MNTSNENNERAWECRKLLKPPIFGKDLIVLEINQKPCELDKVYANYKIISISKNGFPRQYSEQTQLYKLIVEKDGIESILQLGWRDSKTLAYHYHFRSVVYEGDRRICTTITPDKIELPTLDGFGLRWDEPYYQWVSFVWVRNENKKTGRISRKLEILFKYHQL